MNGRQPYANRREAGRKLGQALVHYRDRRPLVLGLPRGGVVVAFEVARCLGAPLDVVVARKLGAPGQPELGIGAIAPGGVFLLDAEMCDQLGLGPDDLAPLAARERAEMERRLRLYRGVPTLPDVAGRTVIVVDDGLATGVTARAAVAALRPMAPEWLVLAAPVAARETIDTLVAVVDELVCLRVPVWFRAVGLWYEDFDQTTDDEVLDLLARARVGSGKGDQNSTLYDNQGIG